MSDKSRPRGACRQSHRTRHPLDTPPQAADPLRRQRLLPAKPHRTHVCRLEDFRRVATRYDKLARNFLATAVLAATIIWWINCVRTLSWGRNSNAAIGLSLAVLPDGRLASGSEDTG
jgi:hypothetical protein